MNNNRGMTIVEVLLSVVILALVFTALLGMLDMGYRVEKSSDSEMTALNLARMYIEEAKIQVLADENPATALTPCTPPYEDYNYNIAVTNDVAGTKRITVRVYKGEKEEVLLVTKVGERW